MEFPFRTTRNPDDALSIFSLLLNVDAKLQALPAAVHPTIEEIRTAVQAVIKLIFFIPDLLQDPGPYPNRSFVPPTPQQTSVLGAALPRGTSARTDAFHADLEPGHGGATEALDLGSVGSDSESESDSASGQSPNAVNGLSPEQIDTIVDQVSDGTLSDGARAQAAMMMLGMAGSELSSSLLGISKSFVCQVFINMNHFHRFSIHDLLFILCRFINVVL